MKLAVTLRRGPGLIAANAMRSIAGSHGASLTNSFFKLNHYRKGWYIDNISVERLWRTMQYEEVFLKAYSNGREAKAGLHAYFSFYNTQRPHQPWDYRTPAEVFKL